MKKSVIRIATLLILLPQTPQARASDRNDVLLAAGCAVAAGVATYGIKKTWDYYDNKETIASIKKKLSALNSTYNQEFGYLQSTQELSHEYDPFFYELVQARYHGYNVDHDLEQATRWNNSLTTLFNDNWDCAGLLSRVQSCQERLKKIFAYSLIIRAQEFLISQEASDLDCLVKTLDMIRVDFAESQILGMCPCPRRLMDQWIHSVSGEFKLLVNTSSERLNIGIKLFNNKSLCELYGLGDHQLTLCREFAAYAKATESWKAMQYLTVLVPSELQQISFNQVKSPFQQLGEFIETKYRANGRGSNYNNYPYLWFVEFQEKALKQLRDIEKTLSDHTMAVQSDPMVTTVAHHQNFCLAELRQSIKDLQRDTINSNEYKREERSRQRELEIERQRREYEEYRREKERRAREQEWLARQRQANARALANQAATERQAAQAIQAAEQERDYQERKRQQEAACEYEALKREEKERQERQKQAARDKAAYDTQAAREYENQRAEEEARRKRAQAEQDQAIARAEYEQAVREQEEAVRAQAEQEQAIAKANTERERQKQERQAQEEAKAKAREAQRDRFIEEAVFN